MNRAEMRRKAREQEKCRLPLNFKMQLGQVAGLTGQQAMILQNYLKAREDEITEQATDACIREAQEKLERAEDYITITNIIISIYAIKFSWGFTKANKKFLDNWKSAMEYVNRIGVAKTYEYAKRDMGITYRKVHREKSERNSEKRLRRIDSRMHSTVSWNE